MGLYHPQSCVAGIYGLPAVARLGTRTLSCCNVRPNVHCSHIETHLCDLFDFKHAHIHTQTYAHRHTHSLTMMDLAGTTVSGAYTKRVPSRHHQRHGHPIALPAPTSSPALRHEHARLEHHTWPSHFRQQQQQQQK